jgi:hypothetical protein
MLSASQWRSLAYALVALTARQRAVCVVRGLVGPDVGAALLCEAEQAAENGAGFWVMARGFVVVFFADLNGC